MGSPLWRSFSAVLSACNPTPDYADIHLQVLVQLGESGLLAGLPPGVLCYRTVHDGLQVHVALGIARHPRFFGDRRRLRSGDVRRQQLISSSSGSDAANRSEPLTLKTNSSYARPRMRRQRPTGSGH